MARGQFVDLVFRAISPRLKITSGQYVGVYGYFLAADLIAKCQIGPAFFVIRIVALPSKSPLIPSPTIDLF
jgi:hypothetical protein